MAKEEGKKKAYICVNCRRTMTIQEYKEFNKCIYCDSKTVFKQRPEVVRRVKSR